MAVMAYDTKEKKLSWLTRPITWASNIALFGGFIALAMLYARVDHPTVLAVAVGANVVNTVLLIWGLGRVQNAARGRL